MTRAEDFPVEASVTVEALDRAPHPLLAELRAREPVSWIQALDGWLVTRYDLALDVMRDARTFTVDDPRFSTAEEAERLVGRLRPAGAGELRRSFAGPYATAIITHALGLGRDEAESVLGCMTRSPMQSQALPPAPRSRPPGWRPSVR